MTTTDATIDDATGATVVAVVAAATELLPDLTA
jgi:hypothetical protein